MSLLDWFQSSTPPAVLLLDGGVSTYLESMLHKKNQVFSHRSLWSSSLLLTQKGREDILTCHHEFHASGANLLSTVTYQCHFHTHDKNNKKKIPAVVDKATMTQMLRDGVRLAKQAATTETATSQPTWVVASSGCYGGALADGSEYTGNYGLSVEELMDFHYEKARILFEQSPDALAFETIPCLLECHAILTLLQNKFSLQATKTGIWVSLACQNESQLNDGSQLTDALDTIQSMDPHAKLVHAVGINCCNVQYVSSLIRILVRHMVVHGPRRAIVMYPNSGEEWDAANETWREHAGCTAPNDFADQMLEAKHVIRKTWRQHDKDGDFPKTVVGGCCRTSPTTIRAMRQRLNELL